MTRYTNKQIREFISCPQFGDKKYGKWGALPIEVRETIYNLLEINKSADNIIKRQYNIIKKVVDFINKHCVNHKKSKEFGFKVYTMMVTDELEKVMKMLENGKGDE